VGWIELGSIFVLHVTSSKGELRSDGFAPSHAGRRLSGGPEAQNFGLDNLGRGFFFDTAFYLRIDGRAFDRPVFTNNVQTTTRFNGLRQLSDVCLWHKADIQLSSANVRF
jgi:hypothetical protein